MNKIHKIITLLTLLIWFFIPRPILAYCVSVDEAAAYANFIQNLVNNSSFKKGGTLCAYGNDSVVRYFTKSVKKIDSINTSDTSNQCKAIYIASDNIPGLKKYLSSLSEKNIMTISTIDEFTENGGTIQVQMGRRDFELIVDVKSLNAAQIKLDTMSTNLIVY